MKKNESGAGIILIIGLAIALLVPATVTPKLVVSTIFSTQAEGLVEKAIASVAAGAEVQDVSSLLGGLKGSQSNELVKVFFRQHEEENGFQRSYKFNLMKSGSFTVVEKPGLMDGFKNGFLAVYTPILNFIKAPFILIGYLLRLRIISMINYLIYLFLSIFTCALSLFFMKASIFYYVGFVVGGLLGLGTLAMVSENDEGSE